MSIESTVNKLLLGLYTLGCLLLSALVVTVSLSERLNRRHPVFNDFLYTWIIFSASGCFEVLAMLSGNYDIGELSEARDIGLLTTATTSTLNLSIHLWLTLPAKNECSPRTKKLRTLSLVVNPYILGLVGLPALFNFDFWYLVALIIWFVVGFMTLVLDVALLVKYWRYRHTVGTLIVQEVVSLPFFYRLAGFAFYQFLFTIWLTANITNPKTVDIFLIVKASYPLLAFCVLGLHADVLHIWSTCLRPRKTSISEEETSSVLAIRDSEGMEGMEDHFLGRCKEDDDPEPTSR